MPLEKSILQKIIWSIGLKRSSKGWINLFLWVLFLEGIYQKLQIRGYPIAQIVYVGKDNELHEITISYFTNCDDIYENLSSTIGVNNIN